MFLKNVKSDSDIYEKLLFLLDKLPLYNSLFIEYNTLNILE